MDSALTQFYRQYLQQCNDLCYPPGKILRKPYVQQQIYQYMFDDSRPHLPPTSYQRRILKDITSRIESAIEDPDVDEVSDDLMHHMAVLATAEPLPAADVATKKTVVSYFPPDSTEDPSASPLLIRESPYLLGAASSVGFRTWEACLNLAYYLSTHGRSLIQGKNVIELGAGIGLLSILCAGPLDANYVLSTDGVPEVVSSIEHNIMLNKTFLTQVQGHIPITAKVLNWTDHAPLATVLSVPQTQMNADPLSIPRHHTSSSIPKYDVVLGADITYNVQYFGPLIATLSILEAQFRGIDIIIAGAVRNVNTFYSFLEACDEEGFEVSDVEFECPSFHQQRGLFHNIALPIRVVKLTRKASKETDRILPATAAEVSSDQARDR